MANSHPGAGHELYLMTHLGTFILAIMKTSTYYTFLETLGLGQYNKKISKMFQKFLKDFFVTSVNIELLRMKILDVTYSQYMKEQSVSEYRATHNGNLTPHIQSINKGVKYECNKCEYRAATQGNHIHYKQSAHERAKYDCN